MKKQSSPDLEESYDVALEDRDRVLAHKSGRRTSLLVKGKRITTIFCH
jgi:hypothetical protein